jgi:hypothetical protein
VGRRNPLFDSNHAGFPIVSGSFSSLSHPRRRFSWAGERRQRTSNLQFALPPVATRNGLAPPRKIGAKTRQKWSFSPSYLPHGGTDSPPRPPRHSHRMLKNAHSLPTKFLEYPVLMLLSRYYRRCRFRHHWQFLRHPSRSKA